MFRVILAFAGLLVSAEGASVPRPLADISVPTPGGKIRLSQYRGKVMVVALISTTCEHCIVSMQLLSQLQKEYGPRGFQVFAVAADDMAAKMVGPLTRLRQPGFPLGYLDHNTTMELCDFKRDDHPFVPMYLFVDKKGTVRFQYSGNEDFFKAEEKNTKILIEGLLKQ
jgi:thiol-disulfide isomerase/thioredoxin